jgi:hypothetical protein
VTADSRDPAIAAAQRAWEDRYDGDTQRFKESVHIDGVGALAVTAAREALAPLRAKHHKVQRPDGSYRCTSCRDGYGAHADWPTGTDRLLYPEEEL